MKEFRLRAFALKKITMLSATSPTFFSFKTFLIPLFLKRQCRKKKAQTQMGNAVKKRLKLRWGMILNLKKSQRTKDQTKTKVLKKGLKLAEE